MSGSEVVKRFQAFGGEPYPDDAPVLVSYDYNWGWIVEAVNDGEYEIQLEERTSCCFWHGVAQALDIARQRGVRVDAMGGVPPSHRPQGPECSDPPWGVPPWEDYSAPVTAPRAVRGEGEG